MRRLVCFSALIFMIVIPLRVSNARALAEPQVMAVYFYADWCSVCQVISPKFEAAKKNGALERADILFITLDLTDKARIHQSILLAQTLGIGDFLKAQGSATGYIALLDAHTKAEISRLHAQDSADDMLDTIKDSLSHKTAN